MNNENKYPKMPGWKGSKPTGREAAFAVAQDITGRRRQVWDAFEPYGTAGGTCDDISATLGLPVHILRPRATELERLGKLFPLPEKRPGRMGHNVTVYSIYKPAEAA